MTTEQYPKLSYSVTPASEPGSSSTDPEFVDVLRQSSVVLEPGSSKPNMTAEASPRSTLAAAAKHRTSLRLPNLA